MDKLRLKIRPITNKSKLLQLTAIREDKKII